MEDGLSQSTALALLQDRRGFLWIATQDGVNRYDGNGIRSFMSTSATDSASLVADHFFRAVAEDAAGRLWLGTSSAGAYVTDGGSRVLSHLVPPARAPGGPDHDRIHAFARAPDGGMWVATGAGLMAADPGATALRAIPRPSGVPDTASATAVWVEDGILWAGFSDGTLARARAAAANHDGAGWETLRLPAQIRKLTRGPAGALWVATLGAGLFAIDTGAGLRVVRRAGSGAPDADWTLPSDFVTSVLFDAHGEQWVGTWSGLARRVPGARRFVVYRRSSLDPLGLRNSEVHSLLEDRDGVLWIGTTDGVNHLSPHRRAFDLYMDPGEGEPAPMRTRALLGATGPGVVWAGTRDSELFRIESATGRVEPVLDLKPLVRSDDLAGIHDLEHDGTGGLWIATLGAGLVRYPGSGRPVRFHRADTDEPGSLASDDLESVMRAADGTLWLGSTVASLISYDGRRFERHAALPDVGRLPPYVWPVVEAPDRSLWIGTFGGGLYHLSADHAEAARWSLGDGPDVAANRILSLTRGPDGALWIGTQGGGLFRFEPATGAIRRWTVADGLPHEHVQAVLIDDRGDVWASTSAGLGRYSPDADRWRTFDVADGLQGDRFYAGAAWRGPDGVLYFGGDRGVTAVHPDRLDPGGAAPRPVITAIAIEGRDRRSPSPDTVSELRLSHRENAVTFRFAELDFVNPARNRFEYRLAGAADEWVEGERDWSARFSGLRPGHYSFELRASDGAGARSEVVRVPLVVLPPYWATWWFRGLLVAAVVSLGWLAYLWRTRQQLAVERLRFQIASRLHDDIGASLSSIAMRAELIGRRSGEDAIRAQLGDVTEAARRSASRLREMVWVVRASHDTAESLRTRIEETAHELLHGLSTYRVKAPDLTADIAVGMELRQDAHLLVKEAIHNAARHSGASHIDIELALDARRGLIIVVRDDGSGFDPKAARRGGNGLALMRRHAERHGGDCEVRSAPGEGTTVEVRIPL